MRVPAERYLSVSKYCAAYFEAYQTAFTSVDRGALEEAGSLLMTAYKNGNQVFVCGNGGSAALADHLACDHLKGCQTDTKLRPRVHSLGANVSLLTAIANDLGYAEVFLYPLRTAARTGDVFIGISCSGDSENIVQAMQWARDNELGTIAMTGFDGGGRRALGKISLHVSYDNQGCAADVLP